MTAIDYFQIFHLVALFLAFAFLCRFHFCIEKTAKQRREILDAIACRDGFDSRSLSDFEHIFKLFDLLDQVSYDRHYWTLFVGKDPMALYNPLIKARLHWYRNRKETSFDLAGTDNVVSIYSKSIN